jgi:hypothetical protein
MNVYHHLGKCRLLDWHTVKIDKRGDNKHVIFTSGIHVNKEVELTFCFADTFSDAEILNDSMVVNKFIQMYGADALKKD